jgi:hypothetical protein
LLGILLGLNGVLFSVVTTVATDLAAIVLSRWENATAGKKDSRTNERSLIRLYFFRDNMARPEPAIYFMRDGLQATPDKTGVMRTSAPIRKSKRAYEL